MSISIIEPLNIMSICSASHCSIQSKKLVRIFIGRVLLPAGAKRSHPGYACHERRHITFSLDTPTEHPGYGLHFLL